MQSLHRFNFHLDINVWALAPFTTDLLHAVVSLVAGGDALKALNLALLALLARQIWSIAARFGLTDRDRLLVVTLFASTPMLGFRLGTLQTELLLPPRRAWLPAMTRASISAALLRSALPRPLPQRQR